MIRIFKAMTIALGLTMFALLPLSAQAGETVHKTGTFTGASDHVTTGTVSIVTTNEGTFVVLGEDFSLDGAPDPHVSLGNNGTWDAATEAGLLENLTGAQSYKLPDGISPADYNEVYIWCVKYSVPLGVAQLN